MGKAIEMIRQQQKGLKPTDAAYMIGMQLIDMIRKDSRIEPIMEEDLQNEKMGLEACSAALKVRADEIHKTVKGSCVCITPDEAEKVIRRFYGLPDPAGPEAEIPEEKEIISLEDLIW